LKQGSGLQTSLPENVHLLTLEHFHAGKILLRLEHFYQKNEDMVLSKVAEVHLKVGATHLFIFIRTFSFK